METSIHNFHVPLSKELYKKLRMEAERSKRPATELARYAIEAWLKERERECIREAIAQYAARQAGIEDLDSDLETASVEFLLKDEEK